MSAADLQDLSDALGIEPGKLAVAVAVMRRAVREEVRAELVDRPPAAPTQATATLSMADVVARVPWSRKTVDKMRREGRIPMVKVGGTWSVSEAAFERAQAADFPVAAGRVRSRPARSAR